MSRDEFEIRIRIKRMAKQKKHAIPNEAGEIWINQHPDGSYSQVWYPYLPTKQTVIGGKYHKFVREAI